MLIEKDNCYLSTFHSFFFNLFFFTFLLKRAVTGFPKRWKGRVGCATDTGDDGVVLMEDTKNGKKMEKQGGGFHLQRM